MHKSWTLRRRLVAAIMLLVLLVVVAIAGTSLIGLRATMLSQMDGQLASALHGPSSKGGTSGQGDPGDPGDPDAHDPGATEPAASAPAPSDAPNASPQPEPSATDDAPQATATTEAGGRLGSLTVKVDARGEVTRATVVGYDGEVTQLEGENLRTVLHAVANDGESVPATVSLDGIGSYRVVGARNDDGSLKIVGQPLAPMNSTLTTTGFIYAGIGLLALIGASVAATLLVRSQLRPLQRIAATATRVSQRPLGAGEVSLPERVPAADTDPDTEVGQVGAALNALLGNVEVSLEQRQASEDRLRRFIADASHELRTPIAAIRGYTELARRDQASLAEVHASSLARIDEASARMARLVDELLLLARLDAGQPLERSDVDLVALAAGALAEAHAVDPDRAWSFEVPEDADPGDLQVQGDAQRLHQVLANLLANARLHTPAGTPVSIEVTTVADGVEVRVADEGPGISPELQARLFERFARGQSSRGGASTGLGLAISKAIVEAHDGELRVNSRPGRTVFTVWLPRGSR